MILWRFFALIVKKRLFAGTRFIFALQVVDMYWLSEHTLAQTFQLKGVRTKNKPTHEQGSPFS